MLEEYFQLRGYEISIANKGVDGIELIKTKKPDILILDLKMPGISGDEVMILTKRSQPKSTIIFVTAYDDGGKTKNKMLKAEDIMTEDVFFVNEKTSIVLAAELMICLKSLFS